MDPGEQATGTRDERYNLVSMLYHALHGAETTEEYILDAEEAGDERLAVFFREAQTTHRQLAEQAKELLGILEVPPEPEVAPDVPLEGEPDTMAGGVTSVSPDARSGGETSPLDTDTPASASPERPAGDVPPGTPPQAPPGDVQRETSPERPAVGTPSQGEIPSEPGRATSGQRTGREAEEEQEKSLLQRVKDRLTGR